MAGAGAARAPAVRLLAPDLLGEAAAAGAGMRCPALERLLARAGRRHVEPASPQRQLCRAFGMEEGEPPVAALTRQYDCGDAGNAVWMRADPVHLEPGYRDVMRVADPGLDAAEADALAESVADAFTALDAVLRIGTPGRWYLRLSALPELCTAPPAAACALSSLLPVGPGQRDWHRVLNLVQMILHGHEVNRRRRERGRMTADGLWCWGAGLLPRLGPQPWVRVYGDDPLTRALAGLCGLAPAPLPATAEPLCREGRGPALVSLPPGARPLSALERDWFAPLGAALRSGMLGELRIATASCEFRVTRWRLACFWRRPRPLCAWDRAG